MGLIKLIKDIRFCIKIIPKDSIVIFSEGNIYYTSNKPLIENLLFNTNVFYITIDDSDKLVQEIKHKNFYSLYIKFDFWGQLFMALISCKLLVTTTPSLNVLSLRRSSNVKHYSYFMHAPVDIHSYQKNSFDYFDSIICAGDFQKDSLELLEEIRHLKNKEKISLGVPYYDLYCYDYESLSVLEGNYVLVAPSWGVNNFLNHIDYDIFEILFEYGYNIIYRPHPMSFKYENSQIENIYNKYSNGCNGLEFILDKNVNGIESIKKSKFMVSAISGVVLDYLLLSGKHVIIVDIGINDVGKLEKLDLLNHIQWETRFMQAVCSFSDNEASFRKNVEDFQQFGSKTKHIIEEYKNDINNFGTAAKMIAKFYAEKIQEI